MKKTQLSLLEKTLHELDYPLRYEKGNFLGGECRLREERIVVVNRYIPLEGKICTLAHVISKTDPIGLTPEIANMVTALLQNNLVSQKNKKSPDS